MDKLVTLILLGFVIVGISACGQTGELTYVKKEAKQETGIKSPVKPVLVDSDILPYRSK